MNTRIKHTYLKDHFINYVSAPENGTQNLVADGFTMGTTDNSLIKRKKETS